MPDFSCAIAPEFRIRRFLNSIKICSRLNKREGNPAQMAFVPRSDSYVRFNLPAAFFETEPLYKPVPLQDLDVHVTLDFIGVPSITIDCVNCSSIQTFVPINKPFEGFPSTNHPSNEAVIRCSFACARCKHFKRQFFVYLGSEKSEIMKVGQFPAWDIRGNKSVERLLGHRSSFWRRGLVCETQSYGIAAFSYYRRIVELIIGDLINDVRDLVSESELPRYEEALARIKHTSQASEKIAVVKDLLPSSLRPAGINPLGALYKTLSEGVHSFEDADCLRFAEEIRTILIFLVQQLQEAKDHRLDYTRSMQKLLSKK